MAETEAQSGTVRWRLRVRGRVQGVWFRGWTRAQARELGLAGFARNLPDGSVEVLAQGARAGVEALRAACQKGPPSARVDAVICIDEEPADDLAGFGIL